MYRGGQKYSHARWKIESIFSTVFNFVKESRITIQLTSFWSARLSLWQPSLWQLVFFIYLFIYFQKWFYVVTFFKNDLRAKRESRNAFWKHWKILFVTKSIIASKIAVFVLHRLLKTYCTISFLFSPFCWTLNIRVKRQTIQEIVRIVFVILLNFEFSNVYWTLKFHFLPYYLVLITGYKCAESKYIVQDVKKVFERWKIVSNTVLIKFRSITY